MSPARQAALALRTTPDDLRALREEYHLSQQDLADTLGVSVRCIHGWERRAKPKRPGMAARQLLRLLAQRQP